MRIGSAGLTVPSGAVSTYVALGAVIVDIPICGGVRLMLPTANCVNRVLAHHIKNARPRWRREPGESIDHHDARHRRDHRGRQAR